jgi:hypothetical protein
VKELRFSEVSSADSLRRDSEIVADLNFSSWKESYG